MRRVNGNAAQSPKPTKPTPTKPGPAGDLDAEDLNYLTVKKSAITNPVETAEWTQKR